MVHLEGAPMSAAILDSPPSAQVPSASLAAPITLLIVDVDGVSRRFIELALEEAGGFQVESALDGAGALDILAHTQVHLIVADTELIDMNGLQLYRRLATEGRQQGIPFVFLSSDARVATRILAFEAGVDDFVVKPCNVGELVARLRAIVERRRRALAATRRRSHMLAGLFSALPFPDLVSMIEQARRSGTLAVVHELAVGAVYFEAGQVVHAIFGNLVGQAAFQALMELEDAQFEFSHEPCPVPRAQRSIHNSVLSLILEAAHIMDTRKHESRLQAGRGGFHAPDGSRAARTISPVGRAIRPLSTRPALSPGIAAQFAHGVGDNFALGDMSLYTEAALADWVSAEGGRQRFHVHLLADPNDAVPAILALAGAPSERLVVGSLGAEAKALGLAFSLRRELLLDVIHVDIFHPRALQASLRRAPSLLLFAPPDGDFLAIGTKARVEVEQFVADTAPAAILCVGNQALEPALRSVSGLGGHERMRTLEGTLGLGSCDLRTLLVEGIRLSTAGSKI
jgi:CheY-like chemotaxis protein